MVRKDRATEERKGLYFDIICGIVNSILALIGIIFSTLIYGIRDVTNFYIGLTVCISYLGFSIFLIFIGIYTKQKERKHGVISEKKKKRDLKPPIVS